MGGNFPAGKREKRDRRKKPLILDIRRRPGGKIKIYREPVGTPKSRQIIKNKNITKNRNLLKNLQYGQLDYFGYRYTTVV